MSKRQIAFGVVLAFVFLPRRIHAQCIVTIAGPLSIDGSPATTQQISAAVSAAADPLNGGYVVSDNGGHTLRRVFSNGTMTTITGTWRLTGTAVNGANIGSTTLISAPASIISDGSSGFYFSDRGNSLVWRLFSNGTMRRFAGNTTSRFTPGTAGDGKATSVTLNSPFGLANDLIKGGIWIADTLK
jgi:hypothetical protein